MSRNRQITPDCVILGSKKLVNYTLSSITTIVDGKYYTVLLTNPEVDTFRNAIYEVCVIGVRSIENSITLICKQTFPNTV